MSRIFLSLAVLAVVLLCTNLLVAFAMGDWGKSSRAFAVAQRNLKQVEQSDQTSLAEIKTAREAVSVAEKAAIAQRKPFGIHIWLGMSAALVTLLVFSISVTYFLGTNRWCQEVVDAFSLDLNFSQRSQQIKYSAFPCSLFAVLLIIVVVGFGAASDPAGASANRASDWVLIHAGLAMLGVVVIAGSLIFQFSLIRKNFTLINEVLAAAEQERQRRKAARETAVEQ